MTTQRVQLADESGYIYPRGIVHVREDGKILCGAIIPDTYRLALTRNEVNCVQCLEAQPASPPSAVLDSLDETGTVVHLVSSKGGETACGIAESDNLHLSLVKDDPTCFDCTSGRRAKNPSRVTLDHPRGFGTLVHVLTGDATRCGMTESKSEHFTPTTASPTCITCIEY